MKKIRVLFVTACIIATVACNTKTKNKHANNKNKATAESNLSELEQINNRIKSNPNDPNFYNQRAYYYLQIGDYKSALLDADRCLRIDSTIAAFYYTKGEIYSTSLKIEEAREAYIKTIRLDDEFTDAYIKLALIYLEVNRHEKAMEYVNKALELEPNSASAYFIKGVLHEEKGDTAKAVTSFQTAIEQNPDYYDAYIRMGLDFAARKNKMAENYYRSALSIKPNSIEALYDIGIYYQDVGEYTKAAESYNKILAIDSTWEIAYYNLGYLQIIAADLCETESEYKEHLNQGITLFSKAISLNDTYAQAYYNRGLCYEALGKLNEAVGDYGKALSLEPTFVKAQLAIQNIVKSKPID